MKNKIPLLHLLVVPVITILVCNGLTVNILDVLSGGVFYSITPLKYLVLCLTGLYGFYLHYYRNKKPRNLLIIGSAIVVGIFWIHFRFAFPIWLLGAAILFSTMRVLVLQKDIRGIFMDFAYVLFGIVAAVFIYPISFSLAVAAFLTVQIICEMRQKVDGKSFYRDRFQESLKTAERVLDSVQ